MKKTVKTTFFVIVLFALCSVTAFADMGSKPRVQITLKNPPQENYYLDLLHQYDNPDYSGNTVWVDDPMFTVLANYNDNGWVPALAQGTSMPIWGELTPDENGRHIFGYFGVPDEFKIIIVTESGQIKVSDIIERKTMEVALTLDCTDMSYTTQPMWIAVVVQFFTTWSITLIIEFVIMLLFFFKIKDNFKHFFTVNTATQILLTVFVSGGFFFGGTVSAYMWFIVIEFVIAIVEMWYCDKFFVGRDSLTKLCYAAVANGVSGICTFLSLDIIMDMMFNLIR
ncbi:MAG: hypothetical protein IKJ05_06100 [Oscillospiraceae bacterium]|nr:hypothetical protein [Oscillospiraceae bacterium]